MKKYLELKFLTNNIKKYFLIFLITNIFFFVSYSKCFSEENVFIIDNIKVEGKIDLNFSREKFINKAFINSFNILKSRILLSRDLNKVDKLQLKDIKALINSFQILEETYRKDEYVGIFKIFYSEIGVKNFLAEKNISFSQPRQISAIFFPALFINDQMQDFEENYFYKQWTNVKIKNEIVNFIMPLEDLDDILEIKKMKGRIEELNVDDLVNKYAVKNYAFAFLNHRNKKLNIYLKTMFNNHKKSLNVSYELNNIEDEVRLNSILKDLKMAITDIWKEENIINLSMPLTIKVKFTYNNLIDLDKLKNTFYKISIINNYSLEELDINSSYFKIYYFGNPKRLSTELLKFGYKLKNNQGHWAIDTY